ncbi:hypothetical protein V498_08982 [Pseudogymnoascus sp. VKM F-4517 (FW-2822)]|nr:hypothetical protein V498_08982 [Pseudogymnoascus sp. VKM F-4517 (FW-2822)]
MLLYPYGQQVAAIQHELQMNHQNKEVCYLHVDPHNFVAICCYKEASKVLFLQESFEVDMTFKRVQGSEINEVVFAAFIPQLNKGFGHYLSELDHRHRPWQWHVQSAIIYCTIHFKRGIIRATGTSIAALELQRRMEQLLHVQSSDEYFQLCDLLINSEYSTPQVVDWVKHKKQSCIASGLNKYCSQMNHDLFERARRHTNAVEQTHFKSMSFGKRLSLLKAVKYGELLDKRDIDQYLGKVSHGVNHSWRTNSLSARFLMSETRERTKKRQREQTEAHTASTIRDETDIEELEVLSQASSSGYSRSSSRSGSRGRGTRGRRSSQPPLRRALSQACMSERENLELQAEQAKVRRLELENRKMELELEERELKLIEHRRRLQDNN